MPATKKPAAKRPAAKKPVKPPPPPPVEEIVEEEFVDEEERQTLLLEDEKYFVDELSEEAQDLVRLLQYLNPKVEESKRQYLTQDRARTALIEDLREEILGE